VYEAHGTDLVMERLDGPTMLHALIIGELGLTEAATLLADLQRRLHELPPRLGADPGARILHLDLHPDNVILSRRGPVVIDWRNATEGPPDLDLALSAVILAQVAVDETHAMAVPANALLTAFLRCAGEDPLSMLDAALAIRRADPAPTAGEVDRLAAASVLINSDRLYSCAGTVAATRCRCPLMPRTRRRRSCGKPTRLVRLRPRNDRAALAPRGMARPIISQRLISWPGCGWTACVERHRRRRAA
jgi:hypothetical protein